MTDCLLSPEFHASLMLSGLDETHCGVGADLCYFDTCLLASFVTPFRPAVFGHVHMLVSI